MTTYNPLPKHRDPEDHLGTVFEEDNDEMTCQNDMIAALLQEHPTPWRVRKVRGMYILEDVDKHPLKASSSSDIDRDWWLIICHLANRHAKVEQLIEAGWRLRDCKDCKKPTDDPCWVRFAAALDALKGDA